MPQQLINTGTNANDGTGDSLRTAGTKINSNFSELYAKPAYSLPTASSTTLGGIKIGSGLQINPSSSEVTVNVSLNNLTDVTLQSVLPDQILKFNGIQWVNSTLPVPSVQLNSVTDVTITTPSNGEFLKFNGIEWINSPLPFTSLELIALSDVTITTPNNGEFLKYNGSRWINSVLPSIPVQLDNLTDVTITSPTAGQVLKYNGAEWVNGTDAGQSGNPFDQSLNTTDNVVFATATADEYNLSGVGTPTVESASDIYLSAVGKVKIITRSPFSMASMTTEQRDALTDVENGDVIYNTTSNKFQGHAAGSWVDLH